MFIAVAHLYWHQRREKEFRRFETKALNLFQSLGGTVLAAMTPRRLAGTLQELPDEIHVLSMPSEEAYPAYQGNPQVTALAEERRAAIRKSGLFLSDGILNYPKVDSAVGKPNGGGV